MQIIVWIKIQLLLLSQISHYKFLQPQNLLIVMVNTSGFATVSSTGGTPSYSYEWFDGSYTSIGVGDSISGLVGGVIL